MADFVSCVERVDWSYDAAERRGRMKGDGVIGTVRAEDAENVAFLEAALFQVMGRNGDRVCELRIADCSARWGVDERGFISKFFCPVQDERRQGDLGNVDIRV